MSSGESTGMDEMARSQRILRVLWVVSVPLWAAIGVVCGVTVWVAGLDGAPFAVGILVVAVIVYAIMVRSILERSSAGVVDSMKMEMLSLRQEVRSLNEKLDGLRRTLEE